MAAVSNSAVSHAARLKYASSTSGRERQESAYSPKTRLSPQDIGAKVLLTLPLETPISSVWALWQGCKTMNQKLKSRDWIPRGSWPQYRVREMIGQEIERRSRGHDSLVLSVIQSLEDERAYI